MATQLSILHFHDDNPLHIAAKGIQLAMAIDKLPKINHTALKYTNEDGKEFVFELLRKGNNFIPFKDKLNNYKGIVYEHKLTDINLPKDFNIYTVFEEFFGYKYSTLQAIGGFQFRNKKLKPVNKLLKNFRDYSDKETYCTGILKCLETIKQELDIEIKLLNLIYEDYGNIEAVTPAHVFLLCNKIYGKPVSYIC